MGNSAYLQYSEINWDREGGCLERTGYNTQLASELVEMFIKSVPQEYAAFEAAYKAYPKNYNELKNLAHRMRGALAYCVIPNLESALELLEKAAAKAEREEVAKFYAVVMIQLRKFLPVQEGDKKTTVPKDNNQPENNLH